MWRQGRRCDHSDSSSIKASSRKLRPVAGIKGLTGAVQLWLGGGRKNELIIGGEGENLTLVGDLVGSARTGRMLSVSGMWGVVRWASGTSIADEGMVSRGVIELGCVSSVLRCAAL